ncbi:GvpL/GvpF family gas vesicle protein [Flavobacterium sp. LS1P28]|uniref:GvpL/GvpF family gas vesicle protein n=1 Tax=unclassified Flavobacterium TaxID=196869 RepID=UPI000F82DB17|nr:MULTISPECIES: GvpL/GvpF family gas vesicle protein [unclassified Flavobacterium]RTY94738.1 GvpL/GvpF family gas vesicle protein [Flavobacterium sp. GSN2]RTY67643.1 GvpL/GvpF family gas vesicle protein [Flavobacterium sp. LB2P53]RTY81719.1 GvpL/GvpF family gas vesicle protein [Flavobacterium sp. LS1P28]RTY91452.1 GvpL/GvpF family gas vesicle protein [Flavobacterium sp. RSP46]RTZ07597.1 GvpL/GvpF family gas vesicle protein [Flavobacterium sp. GSP6]
MINDLIYVYCISRTPPRLITGMGYSTVESLMFDDFHVIVKYVSKSEFSEENFKKNLSDIQWAELNARNHIRVISMIMEQSTVIPFKFGTIYHTKASLKTFIIDYADSLIESFNHIEGKEEWSIKIYCDRKTLCEQIDELSEEAAALEKQIMESSPGKAFLLGRKKTDLIENEMDRICKNYGQKYYDEFKKLSESTSLNNLLPKAFTGREETMILNTTFLVSKNKVADFISTVETLKKKEGDSGFIIEATGPWPPFSFISIKEKQ